MNAADETNTEKPATILSFALIQIAHGPVGQLLLQAYVIDADAQVSKTIEMLLEPTFAVASHKRHNRIG